MLDPTADYSSLLAATRNIRRFRHVWNREAWLYQHLLKTSIKIFLSLYIVDEWHQRFLSDCCWMMLLRLYN